MGEVLTAQEMGQRMRLSSETIKHLARIGRIPCIRLSPKIIRFDPAAVAEALRQTQRQEVRHGH